MTIDERKSINTGVIQNLILENRGKLSISGVNDVLSFDDQVVMVETELGLLTVKGENLRINKLSIDTSEVIVEGSISYLAYSDKELEKNKNKVLRFYNHYQDNTFLEFKKITEKKIKYSYSKNHIVKTSSFPITKIEERTDIDNTRIIISNDNIILQTVWTKKES